MKRTRTSKAWMQEHVNDPFVQRAKAEGYRSRASYKLMEIDDRDRLICPGDVVVDLEYCAGWLVASCGKATEGPWTDHRAGFAGNGPPARG